jgi:hypothetical protein
LVAENPCSRAEQERKRDLKMDDVKTIIRTLPMGTALAIIYKRVFWSNIDENVGLERKKQDGQWNNSRGEEDPLKL